MALPHVHVVPHDDLCPHRLDPDCECCPEVEENGMVSHFSYDKREDSEEIVL